MFKRGGEAATADECIDVLFDGFRQSGVVAVALPYLTLEGQPARCLRSCCRGLNEDCLARSAKSSDGPVRVKGLAVGNERVELGERLLPAREIRGQDAVAGPEWIRRLFVRHEATPESGRGRG